MTNLWAESMRLRDRIKGVQRYEVKCRKPDRELIRFFANWTIKHTLTIEELRRLLDGKED